MTLPAPDPRQEAALPTVDTRPEARPLPPVTSAGVRPRRPPPAPTEAQRAQARLDLGYRITGDELRAAGARPEVV